ncbi:uncharacterized protein K02A2.6-like [Amborella trichopoda]|uniref:uncharacterized protein K02A2.6-like n=1 Tax=Amborella trichopoda TaxID=13333 RepID=UPI0005D30DDD|nr:uncharacterized protein K02A2.6-like [Amborella trichopoda]|eukprot:XP_011628547.1 uncharacterized protein K02A2.6-like [Amborella trichopoda]
MDIIGPIDPPTSSRHVFILSATDYFSKWAKIVPLIKVPGLAVANFLRHHIIYKFDVLDRIISDNGPQFRSNQIDRLVDQFGFTWKYSTMYHPRANGLVEAFIKTLCDALRKSISNTKRDRHEKLFEILWAYRITARGPTPYSLVHGDEDVLPLEIQLPSLLITLHYRMTDEERAALRYQELHTLDEKRLQAQQS